MKKLHLLFIGLLTMSSIYGQDISDALRYSQSEIQGTARFRALSGAFGALGGDMSAVSINPASSAVFSRSHASISGVNIDADNTSTYFGNSNIRENSTFDLNQAGAAFVFASNTNSSWRKFSLAVAYERTGNYDDQWFSSGTNTRDDVYVDDNDLFLAPANSISSYFALYAQGARLEDISTNGRFLEDAYSQIGQNFGFAHQQAFLGFQSFVIDPDVDDNDNTSYFSTLDAGDYTHRYQYFSTGYNGKVSFNVSGQYEDNLYLGLNVNSHFIDYERSTFLEEDNTHSNVSFIDFGNSLITRGNGFSFQLGGIMKLSNEFRVGLTYDSPIWYTIEEETTQSIDSNLAESDISFIADIVNIYPEYKLQTPAKLTGSLAYVFGKEGLISFDYSRKNYGNIKLKPEVDYADLNTDIGNILTEASTYRIGGEYKHEQFSFRGGYRFEESPYADGVTIGDLTGYSVGLGYNFGNTKLDVTYDRWERTDETPLYNVGLTDVTNIDRKNANVTVSLSFNI